MENTAWYEKLVNQKQPPDERRMKYKAAVSMSGGDTAFAMRARDWRWSKLVRWANLATTPTHPETARKILQNAGHLPA